MIEANFEWFVGAGDDAQAFEFAFHGVFVADGERRFLFQHGHVGIIADEREGRAFGIRVGARKFDVGGESALFAGVITFGRGFGLFF